MQDLDKFKNEMNLSGKNVYVGHRYVPKIFGEWDKTNIYEPLSIVQYQGNSFTSRQFVPSGVELTNEEYWVSTGNYNAQVEQYRQEVRNLETEIDKFNNLNDEVVDARNGDSTLSARLDKEHQEVTTKLTRIEYNTSDFGVVGDGVNDDALALQEAINTSKNSKLTFEKNSVVKISSKMDINLDSNVEIDGNGSTLILDGDGRNVLRVESTPFKTDQISALERDQHVIQLTNVDGLEVGDGLVISTDEIFAERVGYTDNYRKGFTTKIRDIVGNSIHIDNIPYQFNSGFPITLKFYKNHSFVLKNVYIINNGTGVNKNSVFLQNVFGGYIENVTITNDDYASIILAATCDFKIKNIEIGATESINEDMELNYGIYLNGSTNIILDNLHIESYRHCVTLTDRPCVNVDIRNSRLHSTNGSPVDSHSSWSYQITNCFLYGAINLGIGLLQIESSEIYLNNVGSYGFNVREDVSKYFRGLTLKNCNIHIDEKNVDSFYLLKLSDVHTEEVGTILIDSVNVLSNKEISTIIALRHSKTSDNFGDVIIKNSNFKGIVGGIISYYGETDNVISKGNQLKKKCHIDNNVFDKLNSITNALNLFSIFTFTNNILDSKSLLSVRPVTISFLTPVTHISNNIINQGSFNIDGVQDVYVNGNIIHYPDVGSIIKHCTKVTVTKNLLNGAQQIDFNENDSTDGFIHVGWNRRLGRVNTTCEINLPLDYINLETPFSAG